MTTENTHFPCLKPYSM